MRPGRELRQLASLLFLLRLQFLHVADELLEQLTRLWAPFFLQLLEDPLLADLGEVVERARRPRS